MTFSPIVPQNVDLAISPRDYKDLPANHLWVHGEFFTLQGEGPFAGKTAYFVRLAGCNYGDKDLHCKFCFVEDTPIVRYTGPSFKHLEEVVPISDIKEGDWLQACDPATGKPVLTKVVNVTSRISNDLCHIVLENGSVFMCTGDHPFDTERGYVAARYLSMNDRVRNGSTIIEAGFTKVLRNRPLDSRVKERVWNLTCYPYNTYMVGNFLQGQGAHVHNCDTSFHFQNGKSTHVSDIYGKFKESKAKVLVVTGGEPLLQIEGLADLASCCYDEGRTIQIETNGVYFKNIPKLLEANPYVHVVISPKAHEIKGYSESLMAGISKVIEQEEGMGDYYLKILVGSQHPYDVLPPLDSFSSKFRLGNIYLSPITVYKKPTQGEVASAWDPELVDHYQTAANHAKAAQLCMDYNFNLSMQMHNFVLLP